jgi:hypothetical protein
MANEKKTGIDRLEDEMEKQILETPKETLLEEARVAGRDPAEFAARMRTFVSDAKVTAGKARRAEARARIEKGGKIGAVNIVRMPTPTQEKERQAYQPDTMAARHGKKLSERDRKAMEDDANELFNDDAWNKDQGDED